MAAPYAATLVCRVRLEGTRSIRKLIMANRDFDEAMVDLLARVLAGAFPPK
jgi:hypothetical protein